MKNFIIYILISSFAIGSFAIIDTVFLLNKGLSWHDIAVLSSVLNMAVLLCELPTGIISDKIGVFKAILLGSLFRALACLCYILDFSYHFIVASILAAVGIAFLSGTVNAATIKLKDELSHKSTETAFANIRYYKSIATVIGGLCGYYAFGIHNHYAWLISCAGLLLSVFYLLPLIKQFDFKQKQEFSLSHLKTVSLAQLKTPIFWSCVIFGISAVAPMMAWQVLFNQFDKGLLLGFLLFNTASLCSSWLVKKYRLSYHHKYGFMMVNIVLLIGIALFYQSLWVLAVMMFGHIICQSMTAIFVFADFHDSIEDNTRNSLESLVSLLDSLLVIPIYLLTGYFLDKNDFIWAFGLSALLSAFVFLLFIYNKKVVFINNK